MAKLYINGNSYPVVGNEESYSVMNLPSLEKFEFRDKSSLSLQKNYEYNWNIEVLINGTWHKRPYPKTGNSISYRLDPVALTRKKVKLTVTKGEGYAELPLYPKQAEKPEIQKVELLNSNRKPIEKGKILSCGDILIVQAQCTGLYGKTITFNLYEYDKEGPSQDSRSPHINSSKAKIDKNGKAEVSFKLLNQHIARAINKIGSDTISKVKNHEYYVVANVDAAEAPQHSPNVNVKNPIYNFQNLIEKSYQFLVNPLSIIPTAKPENKTPAQITNSEPASNCEEKYCIKKGDKSELIREINIRLAGFGGNVPTDEFNDRTEKMIKQFQRDYMKVPETGKICGNVLKAIDEFSSKYNLSAILWNQMKCSCTNGKTYPKPGDKACSGYGNGLKNEYPGLHRSMLFMLNALKFYLEKDKSDYSILSVSSGYRCWTDNHDGKRHSNGKPRSSTNHMGTALDLHFTSKKLGGKKTSNVNDMETIRKDFFHKYMNAPYYSSQKSKFGWESNKVGLEPAIFKSGASGATTWIHYDVREFSKDYKSDKFFIKKKEDIVKKSIVTLANELGYANTCNCLGNTNVQNKNENKTQDNRVDPKTLKATEKIKEFIKSFEGYYAKPYDDTKGYATIGIGYLIAYKSYTKVTQADIAKTEITWSEFTNGISEKRALELMNKKITKYENSIYRDVTVPLYQYEFDALISLLFNCGPDFLKDKITKAPKLRSNLMNKKYEAAANEFLDITNNGTSGLVKRRKHENKIFLENIYENNK